MKRTTSLLAAFLCFAFPLAAGAESHSSGSSGSSHAAPVSRAQPVHVAPARQPSRPVHPPVQPLPHYQARTPVNNPVIVGSIQHRNWNYGYGVWDVGIPWLELGWTDGALGVGSAVEQLMQAYGLTQTPCGPPNLVEIYTPDGSEICTFPNETVGPGVYYFDERTLTLAS